MTKLILPLLAALFCSCSEPGLPDAPESNRPAGSSLSGGSICFESQDADGKWSAIGLVLADGQTPVRGTVARGPAYFPVGAGRVRIVPNCAWKSR